MPYGTLRFVHEGWRVIRVEPTPVPGRGSRGDPNRYIGRPVAGEDRHSYYVSPNVGKQAITLDLKQPEGHELLRRLVRELPVDVFCTNTMLSRHESLGIDYASLRGVRADLIWCAISAMGPEHPGVPGYDPATQALCGYMDLTGESDGPPLQCGPPLIDLKAGDEVFAQVLLALLEREQAPPAKAARRSTSRSHTPRFRGCTPSCRCWTWAVRPRKCAGTATSTASSSRSTRTRPPTATSTWRSAATRSGRASSRRRCSRRWTRSASAPTSRAGGSRTICTR